MESLDLAKLNSDIMHVTDSKKYSPDPKCSPQKQHLNEIMHLITDFKGKHSGREGTQIQRINNRFSAKMIEEEMHSTDVLMMADRISDFHEYNPKVLNVLVKDKLRQDSDQAKNQVVQLREFDDSRWDIGYQ